jgi:Cu-processing system ATP-binding protein
MLEIKRLFKKFGKLQVLDDVNLDIKVPGIYAVLGPNGSGKTTLIKSILGMVIPDKGDIIFDNEKIKNKYEYRRQISYLPQIARFPENLTCWELISMIKNIREQKSDEDPLIQIFDLDKHLDKDLKYLSGGTKQKINLVLAMMFDSPVLIFDEPTAGLDPLALLRFKELLSNLKSKGKIIILTTHEINFVEQVADSIIFLLDGKVYFNGTIENLVNSSFPNINPNSQAPTPNNSVTLEMAIAQILERNN